MLLPRDFYQAPLLQDKITQPCNYSPSPDGDTKYFCPLSTFLIIDTLCLSLSFSLCLSLSLCLNLYPSLSPISVSVSLIHSMSLSRHLSLSLSLSLSVSQLSAV